MTALLRITHIWFRPGLRGDTADCSNASFHGVTYSRADVICQGKYVSFGANQNPRLIRIASLARCVGKSLSRAAAPVFEHKSQISWKERMDLTLYV